MPQIYLEYNTVHLRPAFQKKLPSRAPSIMHVMMSLGKNKGNNQPPGHGGHCTKNPHSNKGMITRPIEANGDAGLAADVGAEIK
jgi:hypothetical protein